MPELTFKTEEQRLAHPLAKLIPQRVWKKFGEKLEEKHQFYMRLDVNNHEELAVLTADCVGSNRNVNLVYFGFGHPSLDDAILLSIAREKLGFTHNPIGVRYVYDLLEAMIILGRPQLVKQIVAEEKLNKYEALEYIARLDSSFGRLAILQNLLTDDPSYLSLLKENYDLIADIIRNIAGNGDIESIKYLESILPEEVNELVITNYDETYDHAIKSNSSSFLAWLKNKSPDKFRDKIESTLTSPQLASMVSNNAAEALTYIRMQDPAFFDSHILVINLAHLAITRKPTHADWRTTVDWLIAAYPKYATQIAEQCGVVLCENASAAGHIDILKWLAEHAPKSIGSYLALSKGPRLAAEAGNLELLKWMYELQRSKNEIHPYDYTRGLINAAQGGHIAVLEWIKDTFPNEMMDRNYHDTWVSSFIKAATNGHLTSLEWLLRNVENPRELLDESAVYAFSQAAGMGHLDILRWLKEQAPLLIDQMVMHNDCEGFNLAFQNNHLQVAEYLLHHHQVFERADDHIFHYGPFLANFTNNILRTLRQERDALEARDPNAVFDVEDPQRALLYIKMVQYLIRRNERELEDDLRFLLSIPAVKQLATFSDYDGPNCLLRIALSIENTNAAQILLTIPEVRRLAEQANFYRNERARGIDLAALARDNESSMTALTTDEQKRLDKAIKLYQPMLQQAGTSSVLTDLRNTLAERYAAHPATIMVNGKEMKLPLDWRSFNALELDDNTRKLALEAYYQNENHTAFRYLSKPNYWMHERASYVYINPENRTEKWSTFEDYLPIITMLWLAAIDKTVPPIDGYTLEGRIDHFINELAHIDRAHNWDQSRILYKPDGTPAVDEKGNVKTEEYDNKQGDRPSCYSGVKRRLFQSVVGHPLLTILTPDLVAQELQSFVTAHFKKNFTFFHREAFQTAMRHLRDGDNIPLDVYHRLKELDITPTVLKEFSDRMTEKFGDQYQPYHIDVLTRLALPNNNDAPAKRLTHFIKLMPATTPEIYLRTMEARDKPKPSLFQPAQQSDALVPPTSKSPSQKQ